MPAIISSAWAPLNRIGAGAGPQRREYLGGLDRAGQHDRTRLGTYRCDAQQRVGAGGAGHVQVDHDEIGFECLDELERLGAVLGLADDA